MLLLKGRGSFLMQITMLKTVAVIVVAGFLILPWASQGLTQDQSQQQMNIGDTQLKAFAKVYVEIETIRQLYESRLKEAKSLEEGKEIENEAVSKTQGALAKQGLTAERYSQIVEIARADEGLRKKLVELINEERGVLEETHSLFNSFLSA
jgi:uncharacterized protein DUF4168